MHGENLERSGSVDTVGSSDGEDGGGGGGGSAWSGDPRDLRPLLLPSPDGTPMSVSSSGGTPMSVSSGGTPMSISTFGGTPMSVSTFGGTPMSISTATPGSGSGRIPLTGEARRRLARERRRQEQEERQRRFDAGGGSAGAARRFYARGRQHAIDLGDDLGARAFFDAMQAHSRGTAQYPQGLLRYQNMFETKPEYYIQDISDQLRQLDATAPQSYAHGQALSAFNYMRTLQKHLADEAAEDESGDEFGDEFDDEFDDEFGDDLVLGHLPPAPVPPEAEPRSWTEFLRDTASGVRTAATQKAAGAGTAAAAGAARIGDYLGDQATRARGALGAARDSASDAAPQFLHTALGGLTHGERIAQRRRHLTHQQTPAHAAGPGDDTARPSKRPLLAGRIDWSNPAESKRAVKAEEKSRAKFSLQDRINGRLMTLGGDKGRQAATTAKYLLKLRGEPMATKTGLDAATADFQMREHFARAFEKAYREATKGGRGGGPFAAHKPTEEQKRGIANAVFERNYPVLDALGVQWLEGIVAERDATKSAAAAAGVARLHADGQRSALAHRVEDLRLREERGSVEKRIGEKVEYMNNGDRLQGYYYGPYIGKYRGRTLDPGQTSDLERAIKGLRDTIRNAKGPSLAAAAAALDDVLRAPGNYSVQELQDIFNKYREYGFVALGQHLNVSWVSAKPRPETAKAAKPQSWWGESGDMSPVPNNTFVHPELVPHSVPPIDPGTTRLPTSRFHGSQY